MVAGQVNVFSECSADHEPINIKRPLSVDNVTRLLLILVLRIADFGANNSVESR